MRLILSEMQFKRLCEELSREEIDQKAGEASPETATDAQIKAGNYRKGHIRVRGFDISIENPEGSRRYYGKGRKKFNVMRNHYGYFTRTRGKDGDQVDVFIGPDIENFERVYVVDQKVNGEFDESKVMLGFSSKKEAKAAYFANYDKTWHGFMHITGVSLATFRKWLYRGRKQRQPFADYVEIQRKKLNEAKIRSLKDIASDEVWEPVRRPDGSANLRNRDTGEYLSPEWFNWCGYMEDGISVVRNNENKYNYLLNNGTLMLDDWYDDCEEFRNGRGRVARDEVVDGRLRTLYNHVDRDGNFLGEWEPAENNF